jgi:hypothetical protein
MVFRARGRQTPVSAWRLAEIVVVDRGRDVVIGSVVATAPPDLALVDALLRMRLRAARAGQVVELRDVDDTLAALLGLVAPGVLGPTASSECGGQPERLEEVCVEEEVHPDDPVV